MTTLVPPTSAAQVYTLSAVLIQMTWRHHYWLGHRGPAVASTTALWRETKRKHYLGLNDAVAKIR